MRGVKSAVTAALTHERPFLHVAHAQHRRVERHRQRDHRQPRRVRDDERHGVRAARGAELLRRRHGDLRSRRGWNRRGAAPAAPPDRAAARHRLAAVGADRRRRPLATQVAPDPAARWRTPAARRLRAPACRGGGRNCGVGVVIAPGCAGVCAAGGSSTPAAAESAAAARSARRSAACRCTLAPGRRPSARASARYAASAA